MRTLRESLAGALVLALLGAGAAMAQEGSEARVATTPVPGEAAGHPSFQGGERHEMPELGIAVTFPEGSDVLMSFEPVDRGWDMGPETIVWSVAAGESMDEADPYPGSCGLSLFLLTELPLDEAMERLQEDDFAQPDPLDGGLSGYVGPYKFFDPDALGRMRITSR